MSSSQQTCQPCVPCRTSTLVPAGGDESPGRALCQTCTPLWCQAAGTAAALPGADPGEPRSPSITVTPSTGASACCRGAQHRREHAHVLAGFPPEETEPPGLLDPTLAQWDLYGVPGDAVLWFSVDPGRPEAERDSSPLVSSVPARRRRLLSPIFRVALT